MSVECVLLQEQIEAFNKHVVENIEPLLLRLQEEFAWHVAQIAETINSGHQPDEGVFKELKECVIGPFIDQIVAQMDPQNIMELIPEIGENAVLRTLFLMRRHRILGRLGLYGHIEEWEEAMSEGEDNILTPSFTPPDNIECSLEDLKSGRTPLAFMGYAINKIRLNETNKNIVITEDYEPTLGVKAHALLFKESVFEILNNAVKAMPNREGIITVRARRNGDEVILIIEDDGPGIPADILPRVFEPKFTTRPKDGGTGLGLALVKDYIEGMLGGSITIESSEGEGTKVTIRLQAA